MKKFVVYIYSFTWLKQILISYIFIAGTLTVLGQDDASLRTKPDFSPGDIVCSSTGRLIDGELSKANRNYDEKMIGVYSGANTHRKSLLYVGEGIIAVKYDTVNGEISRGDFVTSSTNGKAMKATEPGFVLGVALGAVSGEGMVNIRVLIHYEK